ncbi:hypothetical protein F4677DRAFT_419821 [Hypoxylon crocopeplum]|nr:hypothetical protein F4677DRAFT_419821 [Hypoxylon crocopeplum]
MVGSLDILALCILFILTVNASTSTDLNIFTLLSAASLEIGLLSMIWATNKSEVD